MRTYVIHHLGYSFWLTFEKIIPVRRDRSNTRATFVEIWRGEEPVDTTAEPIFAELMTLAADGHGAQQALERLQAALEKAAEKLQLEPLSDGAIRIENRTFGFRGRTQPQGGRQRSGKKGEREDKGRSGGRSRTSDSDRNERKQMSEQARSAGKKKGERRSPEAKSDTADRKKRPRRRGRRRSTKQKQDSTGTAAGS